MCTSPIQINRCSSVSGKTYVDIVPCGKCHECLAKKQSEFAALCLQEAKSAKTMHLFTFTYRNEKIPILASRLNQFGERVCLGFVPLADHAACVSDMKNDRSAVVPIVGANDIEFCPSLCREEIRLFLKRCRVAWKRRFGDDMVFRYAIFGEYGDETHRPHYHGLFMDLSPDQAFFLRSEYAKDFGFCDVQQVMRVNPDGSPGFVKASRYIAKYVSKDKRDYKPLIDGLCELPRRICSVGFGLRDLNVSQLKSFTHVQI